MCCLILVIINVAQCALMYSFLCCSICLLYLLLNVLLDMLYMCAQQQCVARYFFLYALLNMLYELVSYMPLNMLYVLVMACVG